MKIKILSLLAIVLFASNTIANGKFDSIEKCEESFDPNTSESMAVGVYYATFEDGGTWQEANQNFHRAYMSCCFCYPNDCGGAVVLEP